MYVGDPQIGASTGQTPAEDSAKQTGEIAARNDAYNWNKTLNEALSQHPEINFLGGRATCTPLHIAYRR